MHIYIIKFEVINYQITLCNIMILLFYSGKHKNYVI